MSNSIRDFQRRIKQAGIDTAGEKLTVHVLRKCCIQNWANSLSMNVIKELAEHSDIETTYKYYNTVDEIHLKEAAQLGDNLMTTDVKLAFSANSEQNKYIDNFSNSLLLLSL